MAAFAVRQQLLNLDCSASYMPGDESIVLKLRELFSSLDASDANELTKSVDKLKYGDC